MPWFIIGSERKTWSPFLMGAEDENATLDACGNWQYLAYVGADDTESRAIGSPFESKAKAMDNVASFVEG
jgi:hypothetical protein